MRFYPRFSALFLAPVILSGCALLGDSGLRLGAPAQAVTATQATASTPEELDTTTQLERNAALVSASDATGERELGHVIVSLGDPGLPGFWMITPLVNVPRQGRLVYLANQTSVAVDLIPTEPGDAGGNRVSLAALRLLGAPLAGLPELVVYGP